MGVSFSGNSLSTLVIQYLCKDMLLFVKVGSENSSIAMQFD